MEVLHYLARHGKGRLQSEAKRNINYLKEIRDVPLDGIAQASSDAHRSASIPDNPADTEFCINVIMLSHYTAVHIASS